MAKVKTRALRDGVLNDKEFKCNDIVEVDEALAQKDSPDFDADKAAVAYAATLPQNQPKPAQPK